MKICSFNANGIRAAARKGFFDWFEKQNIEVLCIQETKAQEHQLSDDVFFPANYHRDFTDAVKKGYSGVAIYSKKKPNAIIKEIGLQWADDEGRYIEFQFNNFDIISLYLPSGSSGDIRQEKKMEFLMHFSKVLQDKMTSNKPVIICGDFNIIHKEIDIKNWKGNQKNSGVLPEERAWLDLIFNDIGWNDAFRELNKNPMEYTWWSNRGKARENNVGWRIDYQITTQHFKNKVTSTETYKENWFSDHAPLIIGYDLTGLKKLKGICNV